MQPRGRTRLLEQRARGQLRGFRQATIVAVALTSFLLMIFSPDDTGLAQSAGATTVVESVDTPEVTEDEPVATASKSALPSESPVQDATEEVTGTLLNLWEGFLDAFPRYGIALVILAVAWLLVRFLRPLLRRALGQWERADAITALVGVSIWLLALGIAVSVLVGDIRALVGSLGLVGLALSWALQTPIESFTGWLLNSFQGYYRVGDRVAVGEVFGDVYRIDILTTTLWEYGGSGQTAVHAEQPTGRLITFPNSEVLTGTIINYTRDFPYVWDELVVSIANESNVSYAVSVMQKVSLEVLGNEMAGPAERYEQILRTARLASSVPREPQVYVSLTDWGTNLTIRYLVGAREKRGWKSRLSEGILEELNQSQHSGKILPVYPRQQVQFIREDGAPFTLEQLKPGGGKR
jgi:small-conductance mechanosensitive channel